MLLGSHNQNEKLNFEKEIKLPFKEKVNPFITDYEVKTQEGLYSIDLIRQPDLIDVFTRKTKDSIFINVVNPRQIPITYQLRNKNRLLQEGEFSNDFFVLNKKLLSDKTCFLFYQYTWAGREVTQNKSIHFYKNLLSFEVEQPQVVEPGEQAQIKVSVKNSKSKNASNIQLTAGAINAQFGAFNNFSAPTVSYRQSREPFDYDNFSLKEKESVVKYKDCLLYTSPSPRDQRGSRMPSSA